MITCKIRQAKSQNLKQGSIKNLMKVLTFLEFGKKGGGIYCFLGFGLVLDCGEVGVEVDFFFCFSRVAKACWAPSTL
jgi:hypothetical protein